METDLIEPIAWIDRTWTFALPVGAFPAVLERLRGTPARATELGAGVSEDMLSTRVASSWSAKEHIAHLDDLHELDEKRLEEFVARADVLSVADMTNARTKTADHNRRSMRDILDRLRHHREALVTRMENLTASDVNVACLHRRLGQRLRLIDWAYFVAEHDDHHLVRARLALRTSAHGFTSKA